MPITKAITKPTSEPVSLALFKAHLRLDPNDSSEDELQLHCISAARGKGEKYTNQYFASRELEMTFTVNEKFELPQGAGPVLSVTGLVTSVEDLPQVDSYWNGYMKGITINREYPIDCDNPPTYTVRFLFTADPEPDVVMAILKIAADLYENRENSTTGVTNKALNINYQVLLNPYRIID